MNYLRKAFASVIIRAASAGAGFAVELSNAIDFETVELFLIPATAAALVGTIYSSKFNKIFPYWLIVKSGFDSIYILTLDKADFTAGLIIAANIILVLVFACDYLVSKVLPDDTHGKFAQAAFSVCFLIPYIAVFLSLALILMGVLMYEISICLLIICLAVNACIFFKVCLVYVNMLLLTLKK